MIEKKTVYTVLAAALPLYLVAGRASADEVLENYPAGPLEEVIVSAEFRQSAAIELDSSITVLNRETIESATLQHFEEMIALVPNMSWSGDGSRARYFQLRGIGELEQYEGAPNPSVGFIVDDIDLSGVGGVSTVFDIQQVEVLRGPQATRFGASALAGLVYIQSADAAPQTAARAEILAGNDDTFGAGAAVGGGLGANLDGRFSIHHYQANGFYDNVYLGRDDTSERNETVGRGKLLWRMGRDWEAKLSVLYANFDNGYDAWSPQNERTVFSDNPGRDEQTTAGASLKFSGPVGRAAEFVSITGIAETDVFFSYDGEWGNADYWAPIGYDYVYSDERERSSLTQEFRLLSAPGAEIFGGKTQWVLGLYGQSLDESDLVNSSGTYEDGDWCVPCLDHTTLDSDYDSSNYAVFARLDSDLSDRLSLDAGLRLERWQADYQDVFVDRIYGGGETIENEFHPSENLWGGDVSLNYSLAYGSRWYALVSRGYKAGGFNPSVARALGPSAELGPEAISYDPEKLLNFETGIKGLWLEGSLSADVSLFYMDRKDMQLRSSAQFTANPNDFVFITSNAGGHSYGLEAALTWQLGDNWRLHGSLGLLESEVDTYGLEREQDIEGEIIGRDFAHAPNYTINAGATWADSRGFMARLDVNAVDGFYYDYSHDEEAASRVTVNLKLGKEWGRWAVYGWVRNLFDEDYHTRGFSFGLEPPWFERATYTRLGDPRHYGVTVSYQY
ncbi:MAG: TonB-dependent receptor [Xanthomonadales bacterium]|jgi:outer membrane receptor protein involved in Fe transport|nr:TonB-dependent receptor [Xanthomonadales bacterium]